MKKKICLSKKLGLSTVRRDICMLFRIMVCSERIIWQWSSLGRVSTIYLLRIGGGWPLSEGREHPPQGTAAKDLFGAMRKIGRKVFIQALF
jgi:hypothetical protein